MSAIDYTVPGIFQVIQQPNDWACWAATTTILKSWKDQQSYEIATVLAGIGQVYLDKFNNGTGLYLDEYPGYLQSAGLTAEGPQNYLVTGWQDLLQDHGCLWVNASSEDPIHRLWNHAVAVYGIVGDGTVSGTNFKVANPGNGQTYQQSVEDFLQAYEDLAKAENDADPTGQFSMVPQVIHF